MKSIALVIAGTVLFCGCGWFGEPEEYKTESGRTTYRSAEPSSSDEMAPAAQKIPGESKKGSSDRQ